MSSSQQQSSPRRRTPHRSPSFPPSSPSHSPLSAYPQTQRSHPVKSFLLPQSWIRQLLSFPQQLLFALLGMVGLAHYARQIVRVRPRVAGRVALKLRPDGASEDTATDEVDVDQWISKNTPSLNGSYSPSWWLPNGHLQTFFIVLGDFTKSDKVDYVRTMIRVPDGGTLSLDITPRNHASLPADAPTILVNHGLTGNSNESYVRNVLSWVVKPKSEGGLGGRGVVVNLYSAAASSDTNTAAHYLRATFPQSAIHGIGFSLGASVLSRYLGEQGSDSLLSSGIVLACPWNIVEMSHALEDGWLSSRLYSRALGHNLLRLFFRAYDANPGVFETDDSRVKDAIPQLRELRKRGRTLRLKQVDDLLVTRIGGPGPAFPFRNADGYYAYAGSHQLIHNVKVPLLGLNAFDDPVVHGDALPVSEVSAGSHVHMAVTGAGGHLGWFDGPLRGTATEGRTSRWVRQPIMEFLTAAARDLPPRAEVRTVTEDGWTYVDAPPMVPQTGVAKTRIGWKVVLEGVPLEEFGVGAPALQGL